MWSFDVFDTCLIRRHAFPSDVFVDVARRLEAQLRPSLGADYAEVFREARVEAEKIALRECGHEETTLAEIWRQVVTLIPYLPDELGIAAELQAETDTLMSVPQASALVQEGRARFGRAVFISDTYLPGAFIEARLREHGLFLDGDVCFVSSDTRRTKRTGGLFRLCLDQLGIEPASLTHYGDNLQSDVRAATAIGINAVHMAAGLISQQERDVGRRLRHLNTRDSSLLLGTMRAARLGQSRAAATLLREGARSLVASFIGPFLLVLAEWILRRAAFDRIQTLYFFSRDCHALHRVSQALVRRLGLDIDCRYLKVSRQALLLPAVTEISAFGMPWLRRQWEAGEFGNVIAKLDLDLELACNTMRPLVGEARERYRLRTEEDWSQFWSFLASDPLRTELLNRISWRRESALNYFQQEGLLDERSIGVVDLGWHQSCHAALGKVLQLAGSGTTLRGYYLALLDGRGAFMRDAPAQALFHSPPHDRKSQCGSDIIYSRIPVLEHVLNCAPHGTVHHYQFDTLSSMAVPATLATDDNEASAKQILYEEVAAFADAYGHPLELTDHATRDALIGLLDVALVSPDLRWVRPLEPIQVADDQNSRDLTPMIKPRSGLDLLKDFIRGYDHTTSGISEFGIWPELSLVGSPRYVRRGYNALRKVNTVRRALAR